MKKNEGLFDRSLRVLVGVSLLGMSLAGIATPWSLLGIVPLSTGLTGYCPLYSLLGINTCSIDKNKKD